MIQAYVFTGATGSGRREVMADLFSSSIQEPCQPEAVAILLAEGEPASSDDELFEGRATLMRWNGLGEKAQIPAFPHGTQTVLIMLDGRADPVDQMENLGDWFKEHKDVELARIITVVNCRLLSEKPELKLWFDACIFFSDVVLFNKREGVSNKWFSDFQTRFKKECYPCLFEFVKEGHVRNPAEVLFPEALRMSLAFDYLDDEEAAPDAEKPAKADYEIVDETEDGDEEVVEVDDDEDDAVPPEPYFERDIAGRRRIKLPDIAGYLA